MTPTPCATCGYPINPGAPHYANDRGSHHSACGDPLRTNATADRIAELEAALRKINALIDSPSRFNSKVQAVLDSVIDTADVKFGS